MNYMSIIIIAIAAFLLLRIFKKPIKLLFKLLLNAAIGFVVLYLINIFGIGIEINLLNALIAGVLGLPGVIILIVIALFL